MSQNNDPNATNSPAPSSPSSQPSTPTSGRRGMSGGASVAAQGEPMVWLTGGALAVCVIMILGLLLLVFYNGFSTFWPQPVMKVTMTDANQSVFMGEQTRTDTYIPSDLVFNQYPEDVVKAGQAELQANGEVERILLRTGNFDLNNTRNHWVNSFAIGEQTNPEWAMVVERQEWGRFYGMPEYFAQRIVRTVSEEEDNLTRLLEQLRGIQFQLGGSQETVAQEIAALEAQRDAIRNPATQAFIDEQKSKLPAGASLHIELIGETRLTLADYETASQDESTQTGSTQTGSTQAVQAAVVIWDGPQAAWDQYQALKSKVLSLRDEQRDIEKNDIGAIRRAEEDARLRVVSRELTYGGEVLDNAKRIAPLQLEIDLRQRQIERIKNAIQTLQASLPDASLNEAATTVLQNRITSLNSEIASYQSDIDDLQKRINNAPEPVVEALVIYLEMQASAAENTVEFIDAINDITRELNSYGVHFITAQDQPKTIRMGDIVRMYPANRLGFGEKVSVYLSRWAEFLTADPREANQEGGVFPAIVGTVMMTMIMCLLVVPFGVLAALYLREYAKAGPMISAVRIAINNLAGVPSIVFGVFGLGFFIYIVGGYIDGGPENAFGVELPSRLWFILLAFFAGVSAVAFFLFIKSASRRGAETAAKTLMRRFSVGLWVISAALGVILIAFVPFFDGFFGAQLSEGQPVFGKTALVWASFTLALLTLPVVIVATEEALSAVPNSMREGSYACGASKWQTIRRIILPRALPGIMTGAILAMARGAGEVAPLMLVGAVKLAPELPIALDPSEQFGINRSFMHLGFHIFDVGFQSPDSEAARPMVYTTTLLLIVIVATLNLSSIYLRTRLRKRFAGSAF